MVTQVVSTPQVLQVPEPCGHFVQFHNGDVGVLARNVAGYFLEGLKRGEGALIIATPENREAFVRELEAHWIDTQEAVSASRLLLLDARRTLGEFMIEGQPDWARFHRVVNAAISRVSPNGSTGLRAYGEMVGILWKSREYTAAMRVEEYWNKMLPGGRFSLYCSYPIDIFGKDFQVSGVDSVLCDHTHLIPTGTDETLDDAIDRAMNEVLGMRAVGLKALIDANYRPSWAVLPKSENTILWLRNNLPRDAEEILNLARRYYQGDRSLDASYSARPAVRC